jgi:hypothetical protein
MRLTRKFCAVAWGGSMATINMPGRKPDPIERLAQGLGIANSILGIGQAVAKGVSDAEDREKLALLDKGDSAESLNARGGYKALGLEVRDDDSANSLERRYGKLAELNQEKFKTGLKASTPDYALSQKDIAGYVTQGARLVPPGTRGAQTFSAIGSDGKVQTVALLPPADKQKSENTAKREFDYLPVENQEQIKIAASKNANRQAIKNDIDVALEQLRSPDVSEDLKIQVGDELVKTLNSTQGADAVGSEEAKRLASFLEFKLGNFTGKGSVFGRDLDLFIEQVGLNSARLGKSIEKGRADMDSLYGRKQYAKGDAIPVGNGGIPSQFAKGGLSDMPNAQAAAQRDPFIEETAKANGITYDQAKHLLDSRK